ncbi:TonB-dependent receptor domain-containing protein [Undibacterium arcticum]
MTVGINPVAMAQSNATTTIYGKVAAGSDAVLIENVDTGLRRTLTPDSNGRFQATAMPPGHYKVQAMKGTAVVGTTEVDALAGQGAEATFAAAPVAGVQSVQVTGARRTIDVSNSNNGATFTAKELAKLPIAQSVDAIIQLAPNTTRADSRYAAGASFGGGGASENAYYVNGFPVTNPLTQLGASELPFGAISQAQVLTGGFGAEFGRSVGGVVNITTKSGTNNWEMGAQVSIAPSSTRAKAKDIFYPNTGAPENAKTDNTLYRRNEDNKVEQKTYGAYVGGPIIKDKLFMFVSGEYQDNSFSGTNQLNNTGTTSNLLGGWSEKQDTVKRYLGKFDWNITDNHRLELTLMGDKPEQDEQLSGYNYATRARDGVVRSSAHYTNIPDHTGAVGADVQILKYTGNLTDDLTLTALYGQSKTEHTNTFDGFDPINSPLYQVSAPLAARAPGITYNNPQLLTGFIVPPGAEDTVKSSRLDLEYRLGQHTIRGGLDYNKLKSINAGDLTAGGGIWTYSHTNTPNSPITLQGVPTVVASGGGLGTSGYYVRKQNFFDATTAYSNQSAQYIEDRYQVTKDVLVTAGLRNEQFTNKNGDNETFLEMKNQFAPRLAAVWDVNGDASMKVFGSAGRYMVQIPTHLAVRGASRSSYLRQYFTYTGVDANGAPTGTTAITGVLSPDNEFGQAKDARTVAALDMSPNMQDELTLGFEKSFSPSLNFGAKATYRVLKSAIDDFCDQRPFDAWAVRNNVDASNWGGFNCASFNPGKDNDFLVDFAGTGNNLTRVHLTKADLGMPDAQRTYLAVDLFAEHPLRNGWYGKVNYTWSRSRGNTEGQTLSDVAQTDVSATQTWDHRELMENSNGLLPNDRKHQIKAYGFYEITPQFSVGGNFLAAAGRPKNCIGNYPDALVANDPGFPDYGSAYHYCNQVASPRGAAGNLPWDIRLDMNVVYKPEQVKGLSFKLDIFNLFNRQTVQTIDELYNLNDAVAATYSRTISYTAPRALKLTAEYNYKF